MIKTFLKVHKKHNGNYQCQTEGPEGFLKANVSLFVLGIYIFEILLEHCILILYI